MNPEGNGAMSIRVCLYCARVPGEAFRTTPLGIAYIASYLIEHLKLPKEQVRIVDSLEEAIEFKPTLVGVSSTSQALQDATAFAKSCKDAFSCVTVLGGYHLSCLPEQLPQEFDLGVIGEGELTFEEVISLHLRNDINTATLSRVNGIVHWDGEERHITARREFIADINELPWPVRHKSYSNEIPVFTSRGCPYRCTYCAAPVLWRGAVRFRSSDSVIDEITHIVEKYHPFEIAITDDLWIADKKRFRAIIAGLLERGIPQEVRFRGFVRSNLVDEEVIQLLKKINYRVVRFGGETGSDTLLKKIKGKGISIADHQRVVDLCARYDLQCSASWMFGLPGETIDDIHATFDFLRLNRKTCSVGGFYLFNPIPGTASWEELRNRGHIDENVDMSSFQLDFLSKSFDWDRIIYFNHDNVPLDQFRKVINDFKQEFATRPLRFRQRCKNLISRAKWYAKKIYAGSSG